MDTNNSSKFSDKFYCDKCDYYANRISDLNKHFKSKKHNDTLNDTNKVSYSCECGKKYKYHSGYYRHKKLCDFYKNCLNKNIDNNLNNEIVESQTSTLINNNLENLIVKLITDNNDIKNTLLKENQELKRKLDEKDNQLNELIPKIGNTTNNTINNNQKFNINLFLNEQCKDAMTINEFVKSIEVSFKNLLTTKDKGIYVGLNDIINENMNKLSIYERPIHCTDKKRETLYVKNDTWEKDIDKICTSEMLKALQLQQIKNLHKWKDEHPNYEQDDDLKHEYMILLNKCTKPLSEHEKKLFRNICDSTYIKEDKLLDD